MLPTGPHAESKAPLRLPSVIIPARDEEGCVVSTVQHPRLEPSLRNVPYEIIVDDDCVFGSRFRRNRRSGEAKLKIKEMGSRYLFICLYRWLEKSFSRSDYRKRAAIQESPAPGDEVRVPDTASPKAS